MENQSLEKQMGCMAGFLQLFDRHQILAGKRIYSTKRLPPAAADGSTSSEKSVSSPPPLQQQEKNPASVEFTKAATGAAARESKVSPTPALRSPVLETTSATPPPEKLPEKTPLPLPIFEFKEGFRSSWKFRESPRLSLDSRAIVDGKGSVFPREIRTNAAILAAQNREISAQSAAEIEEENENQRRSPSVVARLMGLEALPNSARESPSARAELRRSASESRASRDLMQCRFIDQIKPQKPKPQPQPQKAVQDNAVKEERSGASRRPHSAEFRCRASKTDPPKDPMSSPWNLRKSFFDSQDFFPEPKRTGTLYGEIEKRLKMRGIDETAKDLETLKQILEALQLKGLLHSKRSEEQIAGHPNFIFDRQFTHEDPPIVLVKPMRRTASIINRTPGNESPPSNSRSRSGIRRNLVAEPQPMAVSPRRDRAEIERRNRNSRPLDSSESGAKSPSSPARRRALSIETQKKGKDYCSERDRKSYPSSSPKIGSKKAGPDPFPVPVPTRSPKNRKQTAEISSRERIYSLTEDESSTISESSVSASSQMETELQRTKMDEYKEGRSLLERCDKLLHSIAEITATEQQPSPVSVLDSSLYKDDTSPSSISKRCIDFNGQSSELKEENWSPAISPIRSKPEDASNDQDFLYVSEILSHKNVPWEEDPDLFVFIEKQSYSKTRSSSTVSRLHRRLLFDTVTEILNQKQQLSPWKAFVRSKSLATIIVVDGQALAQQIWSELGRIRERPPAEDLCDVICGVLARDMAGGEGVDGWGDRSVDMSDAVLDIERLIFKDLVGETIRDMASFAGKCTTAFAPRRKLVF